MEDRNREIQSPVNSQSTSLELGALFPVWLGFLWLGYTASWFWRNDPDLQHGWIVVMLCAYLFWEAWGGRPNARFKWDWRVVGATAIGFVFLLFAQIHAAVFGFVPTATMSLALGVISISAANIQFVYGQSGLRHFAFSLLFFLLALPIPGAIYQPIVMGLQSFVTTVNVEILRLLGIPAQQSGNVIHLVQGPVGIDEACSGIRSLQSTIMATLFIGHLVFKSKGPQVLLFIGGILLAVIGNVLRSFYLSYTAHSQGIAALKDVHDTAGWSVLVFTAVGVILLAWGLSKMEKTVTCQSKQAEELPVKSP